MKAAATIRFQMPHTGGVVVALRNRRTSWYAIKATTTSKQEEPV
jgi:hypothetical protein